MKKETHKEKNALDSNIVQKFWPCSISKRWGVKQSDTRHGGAPTIESSPDVSRVIDWLLTRHVLLRMIWKHRNTEIRNHQDWKKVDTRSAYCYWKKRVPALNLSYAQRLIKTSADQIRKHTCKKVHNQETKTAFSTLATLNVRRPITHNANENRGQRYNKHLSMTVAAFRLQRNGVWEEQKNNCEACPYSKNN